MSNDIKSQPQAAPPDLGRSPQPNLAHPRPQERGFRTGDASDLHAHPNLPFRAMAASPKIANPSESVSQLRFSSGHDFSRAVSEPKSVRLQPLRDQLCGRETDSSRLKMQSGRPFLTESDPQTEFDLSHTKQRTEKFLTEARPHIKDFIKLPNFSPISRPKEPSKTSRLRVKRVLISPLLARPLRPFTPNIPVCTIAFLTGTDQQTEIDLSYRKQRTEEFLTEARPHIKDFIKLPNFSPIFRAKKCSKRLRLRPLQHAQLPHRSQRPARGRRHRPHRRLIVELFGRKIGNRPRLNRRINFFDPGLQRPLAPKIQSSLDLLERDAIISPVPILHPHNFRPRHHASNRRSQLLDLQVQPRRPHIKNLARNRARLHLQTRRHRPRRILHMQERTPLLSIQHRNLPGGRRPR